MTSEETILQISNDISEDITPSATKKQLIDTIRYWMKQYTELDCRKMSEDCKKSIAACEKLTDYFKQMNHDATSKSPKNR